MRLWAYEQQTVIPVKLPILAAGNYFDGAVLGHSEALAKNQNLEIKISQKIVTLSAVVSCSFNGMSVL